jgi:hypothetical protein
MDGTRFDELTRKLGSGLNRRQVLRGLLGGAGAFTVASVFEQSAGAQACDPNADTVTCPEGSWHEGLTKKPDGGCCNGNGNCCSNICENNLCVAGEVPECIPEGVECSEVAPCCEGLNCMTGVCEGVEECVEEGGNCSAGECCDGLVCFEGLCLPCSGDGEFCEISDDCCGDLICVDSYCAPPSDCADIGEICEVSADCCGAYICVNYYCGLDLPDTGVAGNSSGSSAALTAAIAGGAVAAVAAKVLRDKPMRDTLEG